MESLLEKIERLDNRGYKAYRELKGVYDFKKYTLHIDRVQSDPFAPPSRLRIRVSQGVAGFPPDIFSTRSREIASRDFIARTMGKAIARNAKGRRGTGKSGVVSIAPCGQEILQRTSVFIDTGWVEARITASLPAYGRRIAGGEARAMFFDELPRIVEESLIFANIDNDALLKHAVCMEEADYIRGWLKECGLVSFVADGAVLPRRSGVDDSPLSGGNVVPFRSPESMRVEAVLPGGTRITGMGIKEGVTLIAGGGFHGKSTLLKAIEAGIYNHIPGDGREKVVTVGSAVKIRAEDGRRVEKVDISPFIKNLPFNRETEGFSTDDASGSTSQAANIIEAIEAGAETLILDEDTSATNFMIRDHRMQELVSSDMEPITPFVDKVRQLYNELGISTVMVMGGSGDYFDVADSVLCMNDYRPLDTTDKAREIAGRYRSERKREGGDTFGSIRSRVPCGESLDPSRGRKDVKISVKGLHTILFGRDLIDLSSVEQLVDIGQTRALSDAIYYAAGHMDARKTMEEVLDKVFEDIGKGGLDILSPFISGEYACFRRHELSAAINRLRTLAVK